MRMAHPVPSHHVNMKIMRTAAIARPTRLVCATKVSTVPTKSKLLRLMTLLSPAFPVGGFSYSHGIEFANEIGLVKGADSLRRWVRAAIVEGGGKIDAQLLLAAYDAAMADDWSSLLWVAERAACLRGTTETELESTAQGDAFLAMVRNVWCDDRLDRLAAELMAADRPAAYPIAVGASGAWFGIHAESLLPAYLHAFAANLVSAGVRLIPLGQTDGQRVLAALEADVLTAARVARNRSFGDLGSATTMVDWTSMRHETQYTRLFRS